MKTIGYQCETCGIMWMEEGNLQITCPRCSVDPMLRQLFAKLIEISCENPKLVTLSELDSFACMLSDLDAAYSAWDWPEYKEHLENFKN